MLGEVTVTLDVPAVAKTVEATGSNGQPREVMWARTSSRKRCGHGSGDFRQSSFSHCSIDTIGLVAPSPRAQNERPKMLSHVSSSVAMSSSVPVPASRRCRTCTIQ